LGNRALTGIVARSMMGADFWSTEMRKPPTSLPAVAGVLLNSSVSIATTRYTSTAKSKTFANAALIEMRLCTS
jgi:hypothetical protein